MLKLKAPRKAHRLAGAGATLRPYKVNSFSSVATRTSMWNWKTDKDRSIHEGERPAYMVYAAIDENEQFLLIVEQQFYKKNNKREKRSRVVPFPRLILPSKYAFSVDLSKERDFVYASGKMRRSRGSWANNRDVMIDGTFDASCRLH